MILDPLDFEPEDHPVERRRIRRAETTTPAGTWKDTLTIVTNRRVYVFTPGPTRGTAVTEFVAEHDVAPGALRTAGGLSTTALVIELSDGAGQVSIVQNGPPCACGGWNLGTYQPFTGPRRSGT